MSRRARCWPRRCDASFAADVYACLRREQRGPCAVAPRPAQPATLAPPPPRAPSGPARRTTGGKVLFLTRPLFVALAAAAALCLVYRSGAWLRLLGGLVLGARGVDRARACAGGGARACARVGRAHVRGSGARARACACGRTAPPAPRAPRRRRGRAAAARVAAVAQPQGAAGERAAGVPGRVVRRARRAAGHAPAGPGGAACAACAAACGLRRTPSGARGRRPHPLPRPPFAGAASRRRTTARATTTRCERRRRAPVWTQTSSGGASPRAHQ